MLIANKGKLELRALKFETEIASPSQPFIWRFFSRLRPSVFLSHLMLTLIFCFVGAKESLSQRQAFPMPGKIADQVKFWEKIFYYYPAHTTVIHDTVDSNQIIDIIDFKSWAEQNRLSVLPSRRQRDRIVDAYLKRYRLAFKRFRRLGKSALRFGPIENRIFSVYRDSKPNLNRLYQGRAKIRGQGGLADEFLLAASRAQTYLSFMEQTFRNEEVPTVVTRLAFVESMFNIHAKSKVGASGIWQFMPQTAKRYMHINKLVDERNSPFKATRGAAKLLAGNYSVLQSWPLAITAYNHGLRGIQRAIKKTKSKDLGQIVERYHAPSFGYASKNFYSEFLAAVNVYNRLSKENRFGMERSPAKYGALKFNRRLTLHQLLNQVQLKKSELLKYNHGLRSKAFSRYRHQKLPKAFEIYLPQKMISKIVKNDLKNDGDRVYAAIR